MQVSLLSITTRRVILGIWKTSIFLTFSFFFCFLRSFLFLLSLSFELERERERRLVLCRLRSRSLLWLLDLDLCLLSLIDLSLLLLGDAERSSRFLEEVPAGSRERERDLLWCFRSCGLSDRLYRSRLFLRSERECSRSAIIVGGGQAQLSINFYH
jgi:hypothetical protein